MLFKIFFLYLLAFSALSKLQFLDDEELPIYLSIETDPSKDEYIESFIIQRLMAISLKAQNQDVNEDIRDILIEGHELLRKPNSWHTTTYYVGKNPKRTESPFYNDFKEDVHVELNLSTFVYIPGKIIAAPVFPDYKLIDNKYPHMTLMVGSYTAVESNAVLSTVFELVKYKELYENGKLHDDSFELYEEFTNLEVTKFDGSKDIVKKAYIIKTRGHVLLDGVTKKMFSDK
jgi:hypothetical protein